MNLVARLVRVGVNLEFRELGRQFVVGTDFVQAVHRSEVLIRTQALRQVDVWHMVKFVEVVDLVVGGGPRVTFGAKWKFESVLRKALVLGRVRNAELVYHFPFGLDQIGAVWRRLG